MLLVLAQWLQEDFGFLRVFNYITFLGHYRLLQHNNHAKSLVISAWISTKIKSSCSSVYLFFNITLIKKYVKFYYFFMNTKPRSRNI